MGIRESDPAQPRYQRGSINQMDHAQRKARVSSPTAARTVTGVQSPLPRRRRTFQIESGERRTRISQLALRIAFEASPVRLPGSLSLSICAAEDGVLETHPGNGASRFPGGGRALAASSSMAESGAVEAHALRHALVSSEARPLAGSLSMWCAGRESNPHVRRHRFLGPARLPVTPPALESGYRVSNPGPRPWQGRALPLSYIRMEPSPRFELGPSAVPGRRSDRWSYEGTCWPGWNRTSVVTWCQAGLCQQGSRPAGAPARCCPRLAGRTRSARSLDPGAECPRRDSNAHCRPPQGRASCRWATRT